MRKIKETVLVKMKKEVPNNPKRKGEDLCGK